MLINGPYESRKHGESWQIIGSMKEFVDAGIGMEWTRPFLNNDGEQRVSLRSATSGVDAVYFKEQLVKAEAYLKRDAPKSMRGWAMASPDQSVVFMQWIVTMVDKKLTPSKCVKFGMLDSSDGKLVVYLMYKDGWVNADGRVLDKAVGEASEILEWIEDGQQDDGS